MVLDYGCESLLNSTKEEPIIEYTNTHISVSVTISISVDVSISNKIITLNKTAKVLRQVQPGFTRGGGGRIHRKKNVHILYI